MSLEHVITRVMESTQYLPEAKVTIAVEELQQEQQNEILVFLSERPIQNVSLIGLIRDNGVVSQYNRGKFYGCRNSEGRLEGVALIGHATLIDARTYRSIVKFTKIARTQTNTHMIIGEQSEIGQFWSHYAAGRIPMRHACRELLFELRNPLDVSNENHDLRLATLEDLELVAPVHAAIAEAESGINPLKVDPEGFLSRCARRIEKKRVWLLIENGKLIFKADVQADTPDVIYLEGIWVNPDRRENGIGKHCLSKICRNLITRTKTICVLVNSENLSAQNFYRRCNFYATSTYDTIFLDKKINNTAH